MVSIEMVENGLARYMETELIPKLPREGIKGFGVGFMATLLIRRAGSLIREYGKKPAMQAMGLISVDGAVDLDAVQEALAANVPPNGVAIDLLGGIQLRMHKADLDCICDYIRGVK